VNGGELEAIPLGGLADVESDWSRLAESAGSPFLTWEWASTWWRHFGAGELRLVGCRAEGRLLAILPLYRGAGRVRALRFLGHGHAGELGPVCDPRDAPEALEALVRYLRDGSTGWDVFLAHDVVPAFDWAARLGGKALERTPSPVVELGGATWDAYLASRSKSFEDDLRKNIRRLGRAHALVYRQTGNPEELRGDLDVLFSLHDARWGERASRYFSGSEAFHREVAAQAFERGWLRLAFLELDGRAVAANYGFRLGGRAWTYNAGRDPSVPGAGLLMTAMDIEHALDEGATEYHLGRGGSPFKERFATVAAKVETIGVSRTVVGRASLAARRYSRALPRRVRSSLEGAAAS
jgi:CelD/BcsL family acetyltransferase involved in cellulose biosynthesis